MAVHSDKMNIKEDSENFVARILKARKARKSRKSRKSRNAYSRLEERRNWLSNVENDN